MGLVLLASPSRGSEWSNRLEWLRAIFKNKMAGELDRDNDFVLDLDSRFADLVAQKRIPRLVGIDAFENKFIVPGFFFNSEHIVKATDSASYFGAYRILPNTEHFTISKPTSLSDSPHQLLVEFYETRFKPAVPKIERKPAAALACRHPNHGVEKWNQENQYQADSGWVGGGSSPDEFCGKEILERQKNYPERDIKLVSSSEDKKEEFLRRFYYRYYCKISEHWDPVYKLSQSPACD